MSAKHTFSYTPDPENPHDLTSVEVESKAESLEKVVEAMQAYLIAAGFVFPEGYHLGYELDEGCVEVAQGTEE